MLAEPEFLSHPQISLRCLSQGFIKPLSPVITLSIYMMDHITTFWRCTRVLIHFTIPFGSPQGALFHSLMRREMAWKMSFTAPSLKAEQIGFEVCFPVSVWCHFSCVYFCHVSAFWSGVLKEGFDRVQMNSSLQAWCGQQHKETEEEGGTGGHSEHLGTRCVLLLSHAELGLRLQV